MKRSLICMSVLIAALPLAAVAPARAGTSVDIQLHVGDRYPGAIVYQREPEMVVVPETRVYYVRNYDYDLYRFRSYWYYCDGVNWYRGPSNRGPFLFIRYSSVPRAVYTVPVRYRRHWGDWPPGNAYGHYKGQRREAIRDYRHDVRQDARDDYRDDRREARRNNGKHGDKD